MGIGRLVDRQIIISQLCHISGGTKSLQRVHTYSAEMHPVVLLKSPPFICRLVGDTYNSFVVTRTYNHLFMGQFSGS